MSKKEQQQTETSEESKQKKTNFSILLMIKSLVSKLIVIAIIGGGAYWLYLNPQIWERKEQNLSDQSSANETLVLQINQLQNQIAVLQSQMLEKQDKGRLSTFNSTNGTDYMNASAAYQWNPNAST